MKAIGFKALSANNCLFQYGKLFILLYVDDVIIMGPERTHVESLKRQISGKLDMKDLGSRDQFLGIKFIQTETEAWILQEQYTGKVLKRFGMENCKPVTTPASQHSQVHFVSVEFQRINETYYQEIVGSRLFLSTRTRPDIAAGVNILCRKCSNLTREDLVAAKRVLRYFNGTKHFRLWLGTKMHGNEDLVGYSDADRAGALVDRKSTFGSLIFVRGVSPSSRSAKQIYVPLPSSEAEFVAFTETCKQVIWMRQLLQNLDITLTTPTIVYEDNNGAIIWGAEWVKNAKHISIRVKYVKEQVKEKGILRNIVPRK